jgi:putative membrane protein
MSLNRIYTAIGALSAVALAALFWLIYGFEAQSAQLSARFAFLPTFNAACNALSTVLIVAGLVMIRRGRRAAHGWLMAGALTSSAAFLAGYILHHALHGDTRFLTGGWLRPTYFAILISHVLLSMLVLPLVLTTVWHAVTRDWARHRLIARWTYPVWLYVSVTGVIVYLFLRYLNSAPV